MVFWGILEKFKAEVAELADAYGSGPYGRKPLRVQLPLSAPYSVGEFSRNIAFMSIGHF